MRLIGKRSSYDSIVAYLKDPTGESQLTEKEREMLDRWMEAFTLVRNYSSYADAAAILMKRYPGMSRSTAFRACSQAESVFGDISKTRRDGIRFFASEVVRDAIQIARVKNNEAAMISGARALVEVTGANQEDPDMPDWNMLEPHTYEIALPEQYVAVLQQIASAGKIDLGELVNRASAVAEDAKVIEDDSSID